MSETKFEFSRPFPVDKLRDHPVHETIEATAEECAALASRLEIVAIKSLSAELSLNRLHGGEMVEVKGRLKAEISQTCVVTLDVFDSKVMEDVEAYFAEPSTIPSETEVDIEDDRSPEPFAADHTIDLGELTSQHLSLAIDPHPRKPGVVFKVPSAIEEQLAKANPFSVLKEFKKPKK